MANFNDLPQAVREKIYRIHLVRNEPLDAEGFLRLVGRSTDIWVSGRTMPAICKVSKKIEKEAAPILYGENKFEFRHLPDMGRFLSNSILRHQKYIRQIGFKYESSAWDGAEIVRRVGRLKGLEVLTIRLNERVMVNQMVSRYSDGTQWVDHDGPTPQQQMKLLRFPAMHALLTISGIPEVRLLKLHDGCSDEIDGPIPGGFFETKVVPQLTSAHKNGKKGKRSRTKKEKEASFRFLDLPAELRNRVYSLLLTIDGPVHPSKRDPASTPRYFEHDKITPSSVLSILQANKQIQNEADGLFYYHNQFIFYNPMQLQSFVTDIGSLRGSLLRDITVHYSNTKVSGIDTADLVLGHLRQLQGLQKVTIIMDRMFSWSLREQDQSSWIQSVTANPGILPGIARLFDLRGLDLVQIRDPPLDRTIEKLSQDKEYPFFTKNTVQNRSKRATAKLGLAFKHFNEALADAQIGKVNRKLLRHSAWPSWDVFPTLEHEGIRDLDNPN